MLDLQKGRIFGNLRKYVFEIAVCYDKTPNFQSVFCLRTSVIHFYRNVDAAFDFMSCAVRFVY